MSRTIAKTSDPGAFAARGCFGGVKVFRDAWEYCITDDGAKRLAACSGASTAFLSILSIASAAPVTFAQVASQAPHIDGNDIELWLSTLCEMGLLSPVKAGTAPLVDTASSAAAGAPPPEPAPTAGLAVAPHAEVLPVALLVHAEARVRANWRRVLAGRGFELLESDELETVKRLIRERRPAWVVLGLNSGDFDGLHLLRALKRPRAPRISRVCLVVPRGRTLGADASETAARADATATSVTEIVRSLCGESAVGEIAESEAEDQSPVPTTGDVRDCEPTPANFGRAAPLSVAPVKPAKPAKPAQAPANAPVWMNLLYGDAYQYGSFEAEHPSDLELQYPRLMVRMIEDWSRPELAAEINQLIVDDRNGRQGFPPDVMEELWFLHRMHQSLHAQAENRPTDAATHAYPATALLQPDATLMAGALH